MRLHLLYFLSGAARLNCQRCGLRCCGCGCWWGSCCRCLHQRDLLLHRRGGERRRGAGGGGGVVVARGGRRRGAAEAAGDLVEGLALRLRDFDEGEDEEEDEEGHEDDEDPGAAQFLRREESRGAVVRFGSSYLVQFQNSKRKEKKSRIHLIKSYDF